MKLLLPKQHGAWAMLIIPFILGIGGAGFTIIHIPLFLGWLTLYLSTYPLLMVIKGKKKSLHLKWSVIYLSIAFIFLTFVMINKWEMVMFGLTMLPFFLINIYFAKKKKERAFLNDLTAIAAFCIGGVASYYLSAGQFDLTALFIALISFLFFIGSTFYVKTMIREKNNKTFWSLSWCYHSLLILGIILFVQPNLIAIAFLPSMIRAFLFYKKSLTMKQVGILEIINSAFFLIASLLII